MRQDVVSCGKENRLEFFSEFVRHDSAGLHSHAWPSLPVQKITYWFLCGNLFFTILREVFCCDAGELVARVPESPGNN